MRLQQRMRLIYRWRRIRRHLTQPIALAAALHMAASSSPDHCPGLLAAKDFKVTAVGPTLLPTAQSEKLVMLVRQTAVCLPT
jgi:hypothetical protein